MTVGRAFAARVGYLSVHYLRHTKGLFFERGDCQKSFSYLFVPQSVDRVEPSGTAGRVDTKEYPDQ